jgi:hypothetical protein
LVPAAFLPTASNDEPITRPTHSRNVPAMQQVSKRSLATPGGLWNVLSR